jgi:hypothetical protein
MGKHTEKSDQNSKKISQYLLGQLQVVKLVIPVVFPQEYVSQEKVEKHCKFCCSSIMYT